MTVMSHYSSSEKSVESELTFNRTELSEEADSTKVPRLASGVMNAQASELHLIYKLRVKE